MLTGGCRSRGAQDYLCDDLNLSLTQTSSGISFGRKCSASPTPTPSPSPQHEEVTPECAALPLARFDANGDGSLSYAEMASVEEEILPDLLDALPLKHRCSLPPAGGKTKCTLHAGTDLVLAPGAEYEAWLACVLLPLSRQCRETMCGVRYGM